MCAKLRTLPPTPIGDEPENLYLQRSDGHTGWTKTCLHIHLTELIEMELVLPDSTKKNQLQTYKLLYNGESQDGHRFMLGLHGIQ